MKSNKPFRRVRDLLLYENEPVFLAGRLPDNVALPLPAGPPLAPLVRYSNNIWRHWMIAYWLYSSDNQGTPDHDSRALNCPLFYDLTKKKWDLTRYNSGYFYRLRQTILEAAECGIVVVLSLFDRSGLDFVGGDKQRRWPNNPWNAGNNVNGVIVEDPNDSNVHGLPEFFYVFGSDPKQQKLKDLQRRYIEKVVSETKAHWNVFYEIMNEPYTAANSTVRTKWANWVTGVIHTAAGGGARRQLIFYNDNRNGADVNFWRSKKSDAGYENYSLLEGVTFHGDPNTVNPDATGFAFRNEKIVQVSSDAGPRDLRDQEDWNRTTTNYALSRDMSYTAFSLTEDAARGVGEADPHPSPLLRPSFLYHWQKIAESPPSPVPDNFHLRFYGDGTLNTFFSNPFAQLDRGVVLDFPSNKSLKIFNVDRNVEQTWDTWFEDNGTELHLKLNDFEQVFRRFAQPPPESLNRFLYHWRKVAESPPSPVPDDFHLRFYADGSFRTFFVSPYRHAEIGEVRRVSSQEIDLFSVERSDLSTWSYSFLDSGRLLRLTRTSDGFSQDFRRFERPGLASFVRFVYKWDKTGESPPSPVPDRFRARWYSDGSFTVFQPDPPYAELERGEIRQFLSGGRIQLWSHTRSVEETHSYKFILRQRSVELSLKNTQTSFEQVFRRTA